MRKMVDQNKPLKSLSCHKTPLQLTRWIDEAYNPPEEFKLFTIYAGLGKGKSCYAFKAVTEVLMNIYKLTEEDAWEFLKTVICFHPQQFFDKLDEIRSTGFYRVPSIVWDDAGLWLYALDWNDPFMIALGKYMNVARSRLASLVLTTPSPLFIIRKLRGFPDAINIKIVKYTAAPRTQWLRRARGYQMEMLPDTVKFMVYKKFDDYFNCKMPDRFYAWYKPLRDMYEAMAFDLIKKSWEEHRKKSIVPELQEYPGLKLPEMKPLPL
jgi:hypothetical protein